MSVVVSSWHRSQSWYLLGLLSLVRLKTILIVVVFSPTKPQIHSNKKSTVWSLKCSQFSCFCVSIIYYDIFSFSPAVKIEELQRIPTSPLIQAGALKWRQREYKTEIALLSADVWEENKKQKQNPDLQQVVTSLQVGSLKLLVPLAHFRRPVGRVCVSCFFVFDFVVVVVVVVFLPYIVRIRHLAGIWFSRELRGDQGKTGALVKGAGVDRLGAVRRQDPPVLPDAACDGQTGLVPHGFCKCQLGR